MTDKPEIAVGDVVQITDTNSIVYGCFMIVEEIKGWGGFTGSIPVQRDRVAPYRCAAKDCVRIGKASVVME